ncbi:MAG: MgtC/SapB family protein [Marinicellaceae bacterium]
MSDVFGLNFDQFFNLSLIVNHSILILIALGLSLPIAFNREAYSNGAGLRTYSLVAVATCSYTLLALAVLSDEMGKFMAGLVTGIGFIGGGAIMKSKDSDQVNGLADAASIWNMGAMGIAVAWQRFEIAFLITVINYFIFRVGHQVKKVTNNENNDDKENSSVD